MHRWLCTAVLRCAIYKILNDHLLFTVQIHLKTLYTTGTV